MAPVLPMLVPEVPSVDAAENEAGDHDAVVVSVWSSSFGRGKNAVLY